MRRGPAAWRRSSRSSACASGDGAGGRARGRGADSPSSHAWATPGSAGEAPVGPRGAGPSPWMSSFTFRPITWPRRGAADVGASWPPAIPTGRPLGLCRPRSAPTSTTGRCGGGSSPRANARLHQRVEAINRLFEDSEPRPRPDESVPDALTVDIDADGSPALLKAHDSALARSDDNAAQRQVPARGASLGIGWSYQRSRANASTRRIAATTMSGRSTCT